MSDLSVVEETFKKLSAHEGVVGILVLNGDGIPIKSTLDNALSVQYAGLMSRFVSKARSTVRALDKTGAEDELVSLRVRSKKHELVVAPEYSGGHDYTLVVVQQPVCE